MYNSLTMQFQQLHPWEVNYDQAVEIQNQLKENLILENKAEKLDLIAGADVSYSKKNDTFFAAVVLVKLPELEEVERATAVGQVKFPYIPTLLSFREAPVLLKAFEKLHQTPDAVIFDGQGIAHPRRMGLAAHMGLILDLPSVGCAKKKLIGTYNSLGEEAGDYSPLRYRGKVVGVALRTRKGTKPVFVSPGHKMDLPGAVQLVIATSKGFRLPEPTRRAHIAVNQIRSRC